MTAITPVLTEECAHKETVYAKDQPEYKPLPTIRNSKGMVLSRWKMSDAEREAVVAGADVFLTCWTFNQPLQPIYMEVVACEQDIVEVARRMELA